MQTNTSNFEYKINNTTIFPRLLNYKNSAAIYFIIYDPEGQDLSGYSFAFYYCHESKLPILLKQDYKSYYNWRFSNTNCHIFNLPFTVDALDLKVKVGKEELIINQNMLDSIKKLIRFEELRFLT